MATRPIGRARAHPVLRGQVQSVIREEIVYTPRKLQDDVNLYWQKFREYTCEWILRVLNQDIWNLTLGQVKFTNRSVLPEILDSMCYF